MLAITVGALCIGGNVWGAQRTGVHSYNPNENLKTAMKQMLLSVQAADTGNGNSRMFDNDLNREQAQQVLEGIQKIRAADGQKAFNKELKTLETLTHKLIKALDKGNTNATQYSKDVFDACFSCHQTHWESIKERWGPQ